MFALALALCLALQAPPPVDPPPVPLYGFAVVAAPAEPGDRVAFTVHPTPAQRIDRGAETIFSGPPGSAYTVSWTVVNFKAEKFQTGGVTVTFAGAKPVPDPKPGPTPDPKPGPQPDPVPPAPSKLYIVVIEETATLAAGRGAMFLDPALAARLADKKHVFRVVDKDVVGADGRPPADVARFLSQAKGKALPQVYLVDDKGKVRLAADLPDAPAKLLDLITKAGG